MPSQGPQPPTAQPVGAPEGSGQWRKQGGEVEHAFSHWSASHHPSAICHGVPSQPTERVLANEFNDVGASLSKPTMVDNGALENTCITSRRLTSRVAISWVSARAERSVIEVILLPYQDSIRSRRRKEQQRGPLYLR